MTAMSDCPAPPDPSPPAPNRRLDQGYRLCRPRPPTATARRFDSISPMHPMIWESSKDRVANAKFLLWVEAIFTILLILGRPAAKATSYGRMYDAQIVLQQQSSPLLQPAVLDLQKYLQLMTSESFSLTVAAKPMVSPAIHLSLLTSPGANPPASVVSRLQGQGLEAFVLLGTPTELEIFANDERGLAHGIYVYLEFLGVRWLLPGDNWTVVPSRADVTMSVDRLYRPAFDLNRTYSGTGGFFSVVFGRLFAASSILQSDTLDWQRRLRYSYEYNLGRATGEAFVTQHAAPYPDPDPHALRDHTLQLHPEYLAKIDGSYSPLYVPARIAGHGQYVWNEDDKLYVLASPPGTGTHNLNVTAKLNAGNPQAVDFYCDWVLDSYRRTRATAEGYAHRTVSVEPADGWGYANNYVELRTAGVGQGTGSDQTFFIANACARKVRAAFPDASVVLLAYAGHVDPPSIPLEPNLVVQVTPDAFRGGSATSYLTGDQLTKLWGNFAKTMGNYTYWSIPDWTFDEPTFNYFNIQSMLQALYENHINGFHAESTYSAGAMGIGHYLASHLMWNPNINQEAMLNDWYQNAFGPAKAPMIRMLERWAHKYRPLSVELAASYADLSEAESLAAGDAAVTARIDDYARYVHYLRLRVELLNETNASARGQRASDLAAHLFSISQTPMLQTTRDFDLLANRGYPTLLEEFHLHNPNLAGDAPDGPGWARVQPLSHEEVTGLITDGLRKYPAPGYSISSFTGSLVPVQPPHWQAPPPGSPWGSFMASAGALDVDLEIPQGLANFPLRVSTLVSNTVSITDRTGNVVFSHQVQGETGEPAKTLLNTWDEMSIPLASGRYQVHFFAANGRLGQFRFATWLGVPLTLRSFLLPKGYSNLRLYFYVRPDQAEIVVYLPDGLGQFLKVYGPQGHREDTQLSEGNRIVTVAVPKGQGGKVWSIDGLMAPNFPMEMLTAPQAFSLTPEVLMVPSDSL